MSKDTKVKPLSTFRIYYYSGDPDETPQDLYLEGYSAQDVVDHIRETDPKACIVDVAKIVKGWK